ncbi:hypothetical protein ACIA6D_02590 [Streptomyces cacaoi]
MAAQRAEGPGENGTPIPRDPPDQQADGRSDPWDLDDPEPPGRSGEPAENTPDDVPDTDEAGTGRQDAPRAGSGQSDHPVPDEPSD